MDERDCRTNFRQQQRIFNCRIAAANYANVLTCKKLPIASTGSNHSPSNELLFTWHAQLSRPHARCNDNPDRLEFLATRQRNAARFQIHRSDACLRPQIELSTVDIRSEVFEQFCTVLSFESEIVVDRIVDAVKLAA